MLGSWAAPVPARPVGPFAGAGRVPVVVELFISEGCSSCPAADAALRELVRAQAVPGVEVIALGEHVDYWNRLGWKDGFSAPAYTARQRQYATSFGTGSYTPQAVANGRCELVGSRSADLVATVSKAAKVPQAVVSVAVLGSSAQVRVSSLPAGTAATEVLLAIIESGLASQIGCGENAGLLLGRVGADGSFTASPALTLAAGWKRPNLRVVALVQEIASRRIVGVATTSVVSE
ncbi:DUF1223 domain-containing protein [Hymenobacter siberiensis]|uniref:DUF1223 domain-containing protein n=1 Tax=Hymenobacter siberiensis TaxID=2848396 RepID=UPI001D014A59|nr:DUF1223 domain-containing protein [Hymenobacter siberiensis]